MHRNRLRLPKARPEPLWRAQNSQATWAALRSSSPRWKLWLATGSLITLAIGAAGCGNPQSRGFVLPPGDSAAGERAFVNTGCTSCHSVVGAIEHSPVAEEGSLHVPLGGEVRAVQTYGELVTAIVHPSHRFARPVRASMVTDEGTSKMPNFNSQLTVQQLIDITAFLQGSYSIAPPDYGPYHIPQR